MHASILFALLAVSGNNGHLSDDSYQGPVATHQEAGCATCGQQGGGRISLAARLLNIGATPSGCAIGMMPQTCYQPPYGCYAATRYNHRYPAFHGWYYRDSYNYRNYFDYPWHAEMHEPTSHFSYNTEGSAPTQAPLPAHARQQAPKTPQTPVTKGAPRPPQVKATPVNARVPLAPVTNATR